ncbi:MAG: pyridoxamine 5'-phosphate oxidase [Pseudomonadota bacterium]|jgi:pyridoxamine 5'-phosphate oxidase|nr:pyridoxamine 5'-phosphate oxidase [Pseudomonadota bacterium]
MTDVPVSIPKSPSAADYAADGDRPLIPDVAEPFGLLETWLEEANANEPNDSTAMSLATIDADGLPDVRIVLLRGLSPEDGLQFYTNYDSAKGEQLAAHPKAAVCFHWKSLRRQVRVRGVIEKAPAAQSDEYFRQRAPQSRIAAIASDQSRALDNRDTFNQRVAEISAIYGDDDDIPRPEHWGGYRLIPSEIEFWQDQAFRMHDRLKLIRAGDGWSRTRLYP